MAPRNPLCKGSKRRVVGAPPARRRVLAAPRPTQKSVTLPHSPAYVVNGDFYNIGNHSGGATVSEAHLTCP
eukprot:scaffold26910_cov34-Tisochrysis_lutea.AAC.5